ncbi:hypothetical protein F2Q68_00019424 [Brassica cretica]|uniref:ARID domain-containing protein n=1 Tax=Brassica cretica TaxID=69181 RepID=A0A8S9G634_BRACR|nr:hypothetical protein F2Q68_00019424 [Brassica cretica]
MCLVMGKGRAKAVEKRVLDQKLRGSLNVPSGPVYYPTEDEFKDPLDYIHKIKPEAEAYGICKIVPPSSWKPPFGLDLESVKFPTKTQEIHRLQFRPASCNSKTFQLEYSRFVEEHLGKKLKKRVVFEGDDLDLCKLFNAVKRFGGYDKVVKGKKWGEVYQFMSSGEKISKCAKHVLVQLQEPRVLETLLLNCERWQCDNHPLLQETEDLLATVKTDDGKHSTILPKIMDLITRVHSARTSGLSLGYNLEELPKLQTASLKLGWCYKTILLGSSSPSPELPEDLGKPSLQKIQQHLEAGQALKLLPEEYHIGKRLVELNDTGQEWAKRARKVVTDSGALALEGVFELISEGENLPVIAEEELQSLRARSMLHCVCLKPYNSRSMVSCSQCGEWYHTYCVKLHWRPEAYVCSACCPVAESSPKIDLPRLIEPKTPSLNHRRARRAVATDAAVGDLQWKSRKRIQRVAKRSPQVHILP